MKRMNRKGTEKPIEIFVALFIILAVALVMLKLFQSQISEKQKELSDVQQEQKSKELQDKVRLQCQQKCTEASNNGCSKASLASLCAFGSQNVLGSGGYIDLNNDKQKGMDTTLLAGIGVCEDKVYCFHLLENCCAQKISPSTCKQILSDYWTDKGMSSTQVNSMLATTMDAGTCTQTGVLRWDDASLS